MAHPSPLSVELKHRTLWCDGSQSFSADNADEILYARYRGEVSDMLHVQKMTPEIEKFNRMTASMPITIKDTSTLVPPEPKWIPEVTSVDVEQTLVDAMVAYVERTGVDIALVEGRVSQELQVYKARNLEHILQACIFVVNRLRAEGTVWGVGRGSAVASFVLYLIGIHDVDSFKYQLDINEFLGDRNEGP